MAEEGLYLYCIAGGSIKENLDLPGVGEGEVFTLDGSCLSAIVQRCPALLSTEDEKLASKWVLDHQAVVDLAWERYKTVVPFGFGTVIVAKEGKSARENLLEWLSQEAESLKGKLKRLEGKAEYGVQVSWDPTVVAPRITKNDDEVGRLEEEIRSQSTGTAYLLKQKLEALLKQRLETAADVYFKEFYQRVKGCTEGVQVEKVRKEEPPRQMLMNLSCLAPKGNNSELGDELEKIGQIEGFFVRFTGPWPPYSFVST